MSSGVKQYPERDTGQKLNKGRNGLPMRVKPSAPSIPFPVRHPIWSPCSSVTVNAPGLELEGGRKRGREVSGGRRGGAQPASASEQWAPPVLPPLPPPPPPTHVPRSVRPSAAAAFPLLSSCVGAIPATAEDGGRRAASNATTASLAR